MELWWVRTDGRLHSLRQLRLPKFSAPASSDITALPRPSMIKTESTLLFFKVVSRGIVPEFFSKPVRPRK